MAVTFRIYTHVMRLQEGDRERLEALVERQRFGTNWHWSPGTAPDKPATRAPQTQKPPQMRGFRR